MNNELLRRASRNVWTLDLWSIRDDCSFVIFPWKRSPSSRASSIDLLVKLVSSAVWLSIFPTSSRQFACWKRRT